MSSNDKKIRRKILRLLYDAFVESPMNADVNSQLYEQLDVDENDIVYNVSRLDEDRLIEQRGRSFGDNIGRTSITAEGIEHLHELGESTFLDGDVRYRVLGALYEADREHPDRGRLTVEDLVEATGAEEDAVHRNLEYLAQKSLVEVKRRVPRRASIQNEGRKAFERYRDDGVEIPCVSERARFRQATLGPDEPDKGEHLFRDFVELARDEVVIVDKFVRERTFDLLEHVPEGVRINIVTSDRVDENEYEHRVSEFREQRGTFDIRVVTDGEWGFHDRYVIRDREEGWAWGHSFHDSGDTQHTPSELRPINLETVLDQFEKHWETGDPIA